MRATRHIDGGTEWQTSTYCYNKAGNKYAPTQLNNINKLLRTYVSIKPQNKKGSEGANRYVPEDMNRVFISAPKAKDYGNKVVVNAYVYDNREIKGKGQKGKGGGVGGRR